MMTDPLYNSLGSFYGLDPERRKESFEGVGEIETLVFYPSHFAEGLKNIKTEYSRPSFPARARWWFKTTYRTLFDLLGLRKVKGAFNNLPG